MSERADHPDSLRPAFAGAAATFSGIGLGRFAYVPLFPAMVSAGWVTGAEGALIGASNLAGYLVGVLGGPSVARRIGTAAALDCGMLLGMVGFGACAFDLGAAWFLLWRFVSGVGGGLLMALAGPAVQGTVRAARRGVAGGIVVSGIGFGIVVASAAIPALVPLGLSVAWAALAAIVGLLWLLARPSWPRTPIPPTPAGIPARSLVLQTAYGISGGGLVPHMVYFADLAVRGYGFAPSFGSLLWLIFGTGALAGTLLGGRLADRLGALTSFRLWLAFQVVALAAALSGNTVLLLLSGFAGGFSALGLAAIALARARELAGPAAGAVWVKTTAAFGIAQAVAGLALAALFAQTGSHTAVFLTGLALSVAALLVSFLNADRAAAPA